MENKKKKKPFYKRWWFVAIAIIIAIGALGSGGKHTPKKKFEPSNETLSQRNVIGKAKEYLNIMNFSRSGLVEQLEFDGFSNQDSKYAVDKIGVDWKAQAVGKGKEYLKIMSFSRSGLIEQLEFDGFSNEEATYAVDQIGL